MPLGLMKLEATNLSASETRQAQGINSLTEPTSIAGREAPEHATPIREKALRERAERVCQRLMRAQPNPSWPIPIRIVADPEPRVINRRGQEIVLSTGLVERCSSDGQLAAVLALTWADRVTSPPTSFAPDVREPLDLRIGPESTTYGELFPWRQAELVKTGHAQRSRTTPAPGQAEARARWLYQRAGFSLAEFDQGRTLYFQARRD
ncbi:MAG: hypothetical protein RMI91_13285 [Gemmatales bacterium]|nr:hypothetical protein [Gemmatales bacterium]MDW7995618.1 hypothetical protein [Gemmatales bacterium]